MIPHELIYPLICFDEICLDERLFRIKWEVPVLFLVLLPFVTVVVIFMDNTSPSHEHKNAASTLISVLVRSTKFLHLLLIGIVRPWSGDPHGSLGVLLWAQVQKNGWESTDPKQELWFWEQQGVTEVSGRARRFFLRGKRPKPGGVSGLIHQASKLGYHTALWRSVSHHCSAAKMSSRCVVVPGLLSSVDAKQIGKKKRLENSLSVGLLIQHHYPRSLNPKSYVSGRAPFLVAISQLQNPSLLLSKTSLVQNCWSSALCKTKEKFWISGRLDCFLSAANSLMLKCFSFEISTPTPPARLCPLCIHCF